MMHHPPRSGHPSGLPTVSARIRLDLTHDRDLRARVFELEQLRLGCPVIVEVGDRTPLQLSRHDVVHALVELTVALGLRLEFIGGCTATHAWTGELRGLIARRLTGVPA